MYVCIYICMYVCMYLCNKYFKQSNLLKLDPVLNF